MDLIRFTLLQYLLIGLSIYQFVIFISIIASWFGGLPKNQIGDFIRDIIRPIMEFVKRVPHHLGPLDLSPLYAFFLIDICKFVIITIVS
jgi:YggT family protein